MYKNLLNVEIDPTKAIEIAPDIFWVGYVIPNDSFQCHVYLIKNGDESILIDPGSMITFPVTLQKISSIISLDQIKYVILHHQDPDIVGCVSTLEKLIPRDDVEFITHWRTQTLLKHYQWKTPFWLIDEHDWKLTLKSGRELNFVFTPYAHFAGAFCTYDVKTGTMFSSDLFGGLTEEFSLFAKDENYFENLKLFHVHYIPSKVILNHALNNIEKYNPVLIAPQHGSIIHKELIGPIIHKMRELDCGLYMLDNKESDILLLNKTEDLLNKFFEDILSLSSFELILRNLFDYIKHDIKTLKKMFIFKTNEEDKELIFKVDEKNVSQKHSNTSQPKKEWISYTKLLKHNNITIGEIEFIFNELSKKEKKFLDIFMDKILIPFSISFKKEINYENLKEKSITDPLTSLYNREYMDNILYDEIVNHKQKGTPLSIALLDIDHFKHINDTYGHIAGDCVLKELANIFQKKTRKSDIVIRYGGEEFLIVMPLTDREGAFAKVERLRKLIKETVFCQKKEKIRLTISAGILEYKDHENSVNFIQEVDKNLYIAKNSGRNQTVG